MAGGLGLLGALGLGRVGADFLQERQRKNNADILQQGLMSALGTEPQTIFEATPGASEMTSNPHTGNAAVTLGGTGLLGDPQDLGAQGEFIANVFGLPGGEAAGSALLGQIEGDQTVAAADDRLKQSLAHDTQESELDRIQKAQIAANKLALDAAQPAPGMEFVEIPGVGIEEVPKPFSERWEGAKEKQAYYEQMVSSFDELIETFDVTGTEQVPGEMKGRLKSISTMLTLQMADILELGVLSEDEIRLVQSIIQDPTEMALLGRTNTEIKEGYKQAMALVQGKLRTHNQTTQGWRGLGSSLDRITPSQQREQKALANAERLAAEQGLLDQPPPQQEQPQQQGGRFAQRGSGGNAAAEFQARKAAEARAAAARSARGGSGRFRQ